MTATRLVVYSVVPAALIALSIGDSNGGFALFAGVVAEAFVVARFIDKRTR
jgi:hypothetical protein